MSRDPGARVFPVSLWASKVLKTTAVGSCLILFGWNTVWPVLGFQTTPLQDPSAAPRRLTTLCGSSGRLGGSVLGVAPQIHETSWVFAPDLMVDCVWLSSLVSVTCQRGASPLAAACSALLSGRGCPTGWTKGVWGLSPVASVVGPCWILVALHCWYGLLGGWRGADRRVAYLVLVGRRSGSPGCPPFSQRSPFAHSCLSLFAMAMVKGFLSLYLFFSGA